MRIVTLADKEFVLPTSINFKEEHVVVISGGSITNILAVDLYGKAAWIDIPQFLIDGIYRSPILSVTDKVALEEQVVVLSSERELKNLLIKSLKEG